MLVVRKLDNRVGGVVGKTLEPAHLALGILPDRLRNVDVLAPDDGPHN